MTCTRLHIITVNVRNQHHSSTSQFRHQSKMAASVSQALLVGLLKIGSGGGGVGVAELDPFLFMSSLFMSLPWTEADVMMLTFIVSNSDK